LFAEETFVRNANSIEQIREKLWIPQRHPHVGGIELTPFCNLRCVHCYLQDQEKHKLLSTQEIKLIIDKLFDAGVLFLYFTGGEIFTRLDFLEIYIYAKKKGFIVELLTNGTLIETKAIEIFNMYPPASIPSRVHTPLIIKYLMIT
jgi:MoaA/NifB/PqqE/SkfB family radical SAM enzyme